MQPRSYDRNRATITIESRVVDELVIDGTHESFPDLKVVEVFQNFFPSVGKCSVAGEDAEAACFKKLLMGMRQPLKDSG